MVSRIRTHEPAFADSLNLYDIFSIYRDGRDEMRVISQPEHRKNLVGERSYIVVKVSRLKSNAVGEMTFTMTTPVFVRATNVSRGTSKEDA